MLCLHAAAVYSPRFHRLHCLIAVLQTRSENPLHSFLKTNLCSFIPKSSTERLTKKKTKTPATFDLMLLQKQLVEHKLYKCLSHIIFLRSQHPQLLLVKFNNGLCSLACHTVSLDPKTISCVILPPSGESAVGRDVSDFHSLLCEAGSRAE